MMNYHELAQQNREFQATQDSFAEMAVPVTFQSFRTGDSLGAFVYAKPPLIFAKEAQRLAEAERQVLENERQVYEANCEALGPLTAGALQTLHYLSTRGVEFVRDQIANFGNSARTI